MSSEEQTIDVQGIKGQKLTKWKKEPLLTDLVELYTEASAEHQSQMAKIRNWEDALKIQGKFKPVKVEGRSSVQPKLIRKQAEWRYSALTEPFVSSDKLFDVNPVTFEDVPGAKQNELLLNWQFRTKLNLVSFIDNYVRSTVDEGTCIVRLGWELVTKETTEDVPVWEFYPVEEEVGEEAEEYIQSIASLPQFKMANPRMYKEHTPEDIQAVVDYFEESGIITEAVQVGTKTIPKTEIIKNQPTLEICDPGNVVIDPSCEGDLNKALFVVFKTEVSKFQLLNEGSKYQNLDQVRWHEHKDPTHSNEYVASTFSHKDEMKNKQVMYEYWGYHDINDDGHMVPIVAAWIGNTLVRLEESPFPDKKLPVVVVPYLPIKRQLYGETDAELLVDNQQIQGAVMRGIIDLMAKSANGQTGTVKGMLDFTNKRRFERGQDYEFNPNTHPSNGIIHHQFPNIPDSALTLIGLQGNEAESITGVKSFSGGISGESYGRVATGIRGALDAASKREMAILRRLAQGLKEIAVKVMAMNQEFLTEDEVVRVTNTEFVKINKEDLAGNFDLQVDISTAEIDAGKAEDLAFMLQTLGPNIDQQITFRVMAEIAELKRMPELANDLRNIDTSPSEAEQMMQQIQLKKAELELAKLESEVMWNQARAMREEAQAQFLAVNANDSMTGVKHARDIERMKAQAEGNQSLEITKALLKSQKEGDSIPDIEAAMGFNELTKQANRAATEMAALRGASRPLNQEDPDDPNLDQQGEHSSNIPPEAQF